MIKQVVVYLSRLLRPMAGVYARVGTAEGGTSRRSPAVFSVVASIRDVFCLLARSISAHSGFVNIACPLAVSAAGTSSCITSQCSTT